MHLSSFFVEEFIENAQTQQLLRALPPTNTHLANQMRHAVGRTEHLAAPSGCCGQSRQLGGYRLEFPQTWGSELAQNSTSTTILVKAGFAVVMRYYSAIYLDRKRSLDGAGSIYSDLGYCKVFLQNGVVLRSDTNYEHIEDASLLSAWVGIQAAINFRTWKLIFTRD